LCDWGKEYSRGEEIRICVSPLSAVEFVYASEERGAEGGTMLKKNHK
jgi:hypothetical protein